MSSFRPDPVHRFCGFADLYDRIRPTPPPALVDLLSQLARGGSPRLVVDIASGTAASTVIWSGRAEEVVAVEPNADMRAVAAQRIGALPDTGRFRQVDALAADTGLPAASADIVTVSQALHWLEPAPTFREVARILRPGGVFAAYDVDWPPTVDWECDAAYTDFAERTDSLEREYGTIRAYAKDGHAGRMRASALFRHVAELAMSHVETGDASRLVDLARSQGGVRALCERGVSEEALGLARLAEVAHRVLGDRTLPWWWTYRVRWGVV